MHRQYALMIKCMESTRPCWPRSGKCSLSQVACWLVWQQHRLPTLIQYYPSSRAPWTWHKEVREVKPSYDTPHCSGPTTSPSNCPRTVTKHGPCQRMLKGHWHCSHLHFSVSGRRKTGGQILFLQFLQLGRVNLVILRTGVTTVTVAAKEKVRWPTDIQGRLNYLWMRIASAPGGVTLGGLFFSVLSRS